MKPLFRLTIVLLLTTAPSAGAAIPATAPARTGEFTTSFQSRHPLSDGTLLATRMGWLTSKLKEQGGEIDYEVAKETFDVRVPADYDGSKPYGLLVWISAGPTGRASRAWNAVLDKRHLICVGANGAGNNRSVLVRLGLALDAVGNAKSAYKIDDERVYVAGGSGGGRCASILGVACPDVFRGGVYVIGSDYFREIPTGEPNRVWPRTFSPPAPRLLALSKQRSRHVLVTGERDMNRLQTKQNYEQGFKKDGFQYVAYLEVPGMGHQLPPADWFEKAVAFLDDRTAPAPPAATTAPAAAAEPPAQDPAAANEAADKLLRLARLHLANGRPADAEAKLRAILASYPQTPAAAEARKLLVPESLK